MDGTRLQHPAIDAALGAAATLLGMEVVFIGGLTEDTFTFERVRGDIPGLTEGVSTARADSLCHRLLAGAEPATCDAAHSPGYADAPAREAFAVCSYVGVPIRDAAGRVVGTLCGVDRGSVPVDDASIGVLRELATIVAAHLDAAAPATHPAAHPEAPPAADPPSEPAAGGPTVIRRTPAGWEVAGEPTGGLTEAMVLADLIAGELQPKPRPAPPHPQLDEVSRLRLTVTQLEHALTARVTVEQAIGVIAERTGVPPRAAFERLRKAARTRGRRVHDLSREVVASVNDRAVPLPPDLGGRRAASR